MSTRSTIAVEFPDGTVQQIYCHSDGYVSYVGKVLLTHYSDHAKAQLLTKHGDLSMLGKEIGDKIDFNDRMTYVGDNIATQCRFYGRDRGETGIESNKFWNFEMYRMTHHREEYAYILRDVNNTPTWYVAIGEGAFIELTPAMTTDKEQV